MSTCLHLHAKHVCYEQLLEPSLAQTHLYERCQLVLAASFGQEAIHGLHAKSNMRKGTESLQRATAVSMDAGLP